MSTIVVIPAFDEAGSITEVVSTVTERGFDVVVVDDGSADDTGRLAKDAGAALLSHPINRGYGAALTTGGNWALSRGYRTIVHFDADGQHDAGEIEAVTQPISLGKADVVIGSRFLGANRSMPWSRRMAIKLAIHFTRVFSGIALTDAHNGFRAFSASALAQLHCREDGMAYASEIVELVARQGLRLEEVPVTITYNDYSMEKGEGNLAKFRIGFRLLWVKLTQ